MTDPRASAELSGLLEALSDAPRRQLLRTLREAERIDDVCERANEWSEQSADDTDTRLSMYHKHLPRLADHGLVDWDRDGDVVTRGPTFEKVLPLLDAFDEAGEIGWEAGPRC